MIVTRIQALYQYKGTEFTRFYFLRAIGLIYFIAFLAFQNQWEPLIGSNGLSPAIQFMQNVKSQLNFMDLPSIFWWDISDLSLSVVGWIGLILSFLTMCGISNALVLCLLWALYLSIIHIGQQFYGFGWETLLLETGFLAIFLCPIRGWSPFSKRMPSPNIIFFLILWLLFRNMFGAGLIKIRGDAVWKNFTALYYHFETQPIPNPLSWYFHHLPKFILKSGVFINHITELIIPFLLFGPRLCRQASAFIIIIFQFILILSGNLSWLNWLTVVQCIPAFDDATFKRCIPLNFSEKFAYSKNSLTQKLTQGILVLGTIILSYYPITNMINPHQKMNASFNTLHLVNTYGAFGTVGKKRYELVIWGTSDKRITKNTEWKEYIFKGKPSTLTARPPIISPYHYRLDWHIWFAAMSNYQSHPWFINFILKLLQNDKITLKLIKETPFPNKPPTYIKVDRYVYSFSKKGKKKWWTRTLVGPYLPVLFISETGRLTSVR